VVEGDAGERLYLIVEGRAEASTTGPSGTVPLATLGSGELFGEIALLEPGGRRQATVTAVEPLLVLSLRAADFRPVLETHPEARSAFKKMADDLLITKFLKQASPFSTLDGERLRQLSSQLERLEVSAGETIIRQGEGGEECYLLRSGRVEVLARGAQAGERKLATRGPGSVFGEAALLTDEPRNATVRALEPCTLLALRRTDLLQVLGEDRQTGERMLELVRMRDRPRHISGGRLRSSRGPPEAFVEPGKAGGCDGVGGPREPWVRWSYVASLEQVLFGREELVLGEARVELASHLRGARDDEPYRGTPPLHPV
jgi:CRP-like cAMP-binding protein